MLKIIVEVMEAAIAKRPVGAPLRWIHFLKEGCSQYAKKKAVTPGRNLLGNATDWVIAADVSGRRMYPQAVRDSGKRPDAVMSSVQANSLILVELTVPWEDRMEESNIFKRGKYDELVLDLQEKGYHVKFFAVEVGARGLVGRSMYALLRDLGVSSKERAGWMTKIANAAESASAWLWSKRNSRE